MHLIAKEEEIKEACDALPHVFDIVRSFGGDEVIEYPRAPILREINDDAPDLDLFEDEPEAAEIQREVHPPLGRR